jgi:hypothetical protein
MNREMRFNVQDVPSDNRHLVCTSFVNNQRMKARTLIDTGASDCFVSSTFVRQHKLQPRLLAEPKTMRMADGTRVQITTGVDITNSIGDHTDTSLHYITPIHNYDLVLGMSWLEEHNPHIDFASRTINFNKAACIHRCLPGKACLIAVDKHDNPCVPDGAHYLSELDVCFIGAATYRMYANRVCCAQKNGEPSPYALDMLWPEDLDPMERDNHTQFCAMSPEDYEKFMTDKNKTDPLTKLPPEYHDLVDVFKHKTEFKMPEHRPGVDHAINLQPGTQPPYKKGFAYNPEQLAAIKKYIDEETPKGTIRPSKSSCASPVLLVRKPNGGLRVCVDYRALNALTVKDRYPIPLIRETLDKLSKARYFTKLDIVAAFNNLRIREGDEWMTAFITRYGLYEYKVMPFGLCNGPASWQRHMNSLMPEYLDEFVTIYLDDLLIYSADLDEHKQHVRKVLLRLREAGLPVDVDKCEFHVQEVKYLGLILTPGGLKMDPIKVEAI